MQQSRRRFMSVTEAADRYGVHPDTIRRAVWDKRIPAMRVGRQIRLDPDVLDGLFLVPAEGDARPQQTLRVTRPQRAPAASQAVPSRRLTT